jgi:hypothetical protein
MRRRFLRLQAHARMRHCPCSLSRPGVGLPYPPLDTRGGRRAVGRNRSSRVHLLAKVRRLSARRRGVLIGCRAALSAVCPPSASSSREVVGPPGGSRRRSGEVRSSPTRERRILPPPSRRLATTPLGGQDPRTIFIARTKVKVAVYPTGGISAGSGGRSWRRPNWAGGVCPWENAARSPVRAAMVAAAFSPSALMRAAMRAARRARARSR